MLGWEFPPAFTGGLGVACYNIVKTLSSKVNVHLIVPYSGEQEALTNVEITGLNRIEKIHKEESATGELPTFSLFHASVRLSAYPSLTTKHKIVADTKEAARFSTVYSTWSDVSSYFQTRDLYGKDVLLRTQLFARAVKEIAAKKEFDIIHAHDWPTFMAAIDLKNATHKPLILHVHSLETDRAGERTRNEIYAIEQMAMSEADKIIAVSEFTKGEIMKHYGIEESRIAVVHNGAETAEKALPIKKTNEKWISFVGRITFQKGPQFLVETARKLIRVYPNVRFVVAGGGDLFPSLVHDVAQRRLGKYFSFAGFLSREKIKELLASSDAYFMPSVSEPFGLSAMEAVQQGTASVISRRSGAAEVLGHSLRADFWDTDRFANYIYAILKYPKLKKTIQSGSRQDIERLTWNGATDNILKVYDALTL